MMRSLIKIAIILLVLIESIETRGEDMKAIQKRRSVRSYSDKEVSLENISLKFILQKTMGCFIIL